MKPFSDAQYTRAKQVLEPILASKNDTPEESQARADAIKEFIKTEESLIEEIHRSGESGLKVARYRSTLIDSILKIAYQIENKRNKSDLQISVVAVGGYGRGHLNPGSDIDLLFLLPQKSSQLDKEISELVQNILYLLWDTGIKIGHASRSVLECIAEAKAEQQSKTAMMDSRLLAGDKELFEQFEKKFEKNCILKDQEEFLELRLKDREKRHKQYSYTVYLQEPHVKESCGGLRDYHSIRWVTRVVKGTSDLDLLQKERIFTKLALKELKAAYDFIHRVRNELHYHTKSSTDILTLRLQGIVATNFNYPEKSILRRCESFMRDYYRHSRNVFNHTNSLIQIFKLANTESKESSWKRLFSPKKKREEFDGFVARQGLIFPQNSQIFEDDSNRIMRMFQHCQIKGLHMSPAMRKLVKSYIPIVESKTFRHSASNRKTFQAMLERKGDVAMNLRRMHRVGIIGAYMPEFGALDCLVQHEFFHRYTADEHTLRCIDELDALVDNEQPNREIYRRFLMDMDDPYALYLALILHDTGRAENVREHTDGSAMLASRVCTRFKITGNRRSLLTFLVDHHLTYWRYATSRNLDDPAVIEEFATIMRDKQRLSVLLLFTYADSSGTNEEAWSSWKESLMLQLYRATMQYFDAGKENYQASLNEEMSILLEATKSKAEPELLSEIDRHFELMPNRYFRFRKPESILNHLKTISKFFEQDKLAEHDKTNLLKWRTMADRGYSEITLVCWNRPWLIEKACCALASEEISIISADVYTRKDNVVCDLFRVCTLDHQPITDKKAQKRVADTLNELIQVDDYDPSKYLKRKKNYLRKDTNEGSIPFPVRVKTNNYISKTCTAIEVQALDRIALLHDLFYLIGKNKLATLHARICTEKGAAMDTIYVTNLDGSKIEDEELLRSLESQLAEVIK